MLEGKENVFNFGEININSLIILANEPTASLDAKNAADVMNLLLRMKNENRVIIIATHSKEIYENADEVVEIRKEEKE
jgi:putative ABC transport system ATP-binding protein